MAAPVIEATHIKKVFGDIEAVTDISFHVDPGECFGILGPKRCREDDDHPYGLWFFSHDRRAHESL